MITLKKALLVGLLLLPIAAQASDKSFTIYVEGCTDVDQSADLMYAADQNIDNLKKMNVTVSVDEKIKRCGYVLRSGKKSKSLSSGYTDIDLSVELTKFFGK